MRKLLIVNYQTEKKNQNISNWMFIFYFLIIFFLLPIIWRKIKLQRTKRFFALHVPCMRSMLGWFFLLFPIFFSSKILNNSINIGPNNLKFVINGQKRRWEYSKKSLLEHAVHVPRIRAYDRISFQFFFSTFGQSNKKSHRMFDILTFYQLSLPAVRAHMHLNEFILCLYFYVCHIVYDCNELNGKWMKRNEKGQSMNLWWPTDAVYFRSLFLHH